MAEVSTVTGMVDADDLGVTLGHEHVFVLTPELRDGFGPEALGWDEEAQVSDAVERLTALHDAGVATIIDPTVPGLGRSLERVVKVVEQTELQVVPATGYYTYDSVPFPLQYQGPGLLVDVPDPLVDLFVRELREGIADTGIRAHILKCAVDAPGMTDGVTRVLRAVAAAHAETGAPVMVHTSVHNGSGEKVQQLLRDEGIDLSRVVLAHCGDTDDVGYLKALADAGSYLGMDRFGLEMFLPTDKRVATVAQLCADGYAERMMLSQDASCHMDWFPPGAPEEIQPKWHYTHVHEDVLPALKEEGVTQAQIDAMLVTAPRNWLTGSS